MIQPIKAYLETLQPQDCLREACTPFGSQRTISVSQQHTPWCSDGMTNDKEFHTNPHQEVSSSDVSCAVSYTVCAAAPSAGSCRYSAASAAPTMPASFSICATTTSVATVKSGRNLSAFLLTPPPIMIKSGQREAFICLRYSSTRRAPFFQVQTCPPGGPAAARTSASLPRISICPSSVLGTRCPSRNRAVPIPVPRVTIRTTPLRPRPTPKYISG